MSLVERLFPPAELAAMKHAVLSASDEPAAKRRKVGRQDSIRSYRSADSGYNSDDSSYNYTETAASKPTLPAPSAHMSSTIMPASPSSHANSEEEDPTQVIARARARLYSNASLSLPSPPASHSSPNGAEDSPNNNGSPSPMYENYHSPVSVEPIAAADSNQDTTSGCNLGTFISLGLAVTSYERNLLTTLVPEPKALPNWQMEAGVAKRMGLLEARRRLREEEIKRKQQDRSRQEQQQQQQQQQQQKQRQSSYAGFAISCHDEDDDGDEHSGHAAPVDVPLTSVEKIDDFFNIEAACEDDEEEE